MTIREFRKNLSKYIKQLREGEIICVSDLQIKSVGGVLPTPEVVKNRISKASKEIKKNLSVHSDTCPCFMCKPKKK